MQHKIFVNGIKLYAYHGCLPEEGKIGGNYVVNVILTTNFAEAAKNDDLSQTIDYVIVNRLVKEEMAIRSKLIEHVGQRIINRFKIELDNIEKVSVEIVKLSPPINGDVESVAIVIED